jgi:hypothetical protein
MTVELETLIKLTNDAIALHAGSAARINALHDAVIELKAQQTKALDGIGETQKNMVLALEKLNANMLDHKVMHNRIDLIEEKYEKQHERVDEIEHSCSREAHEETLLIVKEMQRLLIAHGIREIREGDKGHGEMIASHGRFIRILKGNTGKALLSAIVLGTLLDFLCHYDQMKKILSIFG